MDRESEVLVLVSEIKDPFSLKDGWLSWTIIGTVVKIVVFAVIVAAVILFRLELPPRGVRNYFFCDCSTISAHSSCS